MSVGLVALLNRPVTIVPRTMAGVDPYGNPTWGDGMPIEAMGQLDLVTGSETLSDRDTTVAVWKLYLLPTTPITPVDRVVIDSRSYEVVGEPFTYWNAAGPHHIEVGLRRVADA